MKAVNRSMAKKPSQNALSKTPKFDRYFLNFNRNQNCSKNSANSSNAQHIYHLIARYYNTF